MKTKITVILLAWFTVVSVFSQPNLLDKKVKIRHSQGSIAELLDEIGNRGGFSFSYRQEIHPDRIVQLNSINQPVRGYLDELFPDGVYCIQFGNKLILMQKRMVIRDLTLRGKIIDQETKEPIPGVTLYIPGSDPLIGTVSDANGNFEIGLPANAATVQLSCIGYESTFLHAEQSGEYNIELNPDRKELEEVVITYYVKPKDEKLNGAVSIIPEKQLERIGTGNIENVIQGNAAGVNVVSNSGMPGASLQVKVRGIHSLINNDPVYYLDGVQIQPALLYSISPYDLKSVEIVKDGGSLAEYGSKAGNGVILLESRSSEEGKTHFTFNSYTGIQQLQKKLDLMNADEYYELTRRNNLNVAENGINTDWQDLFFHPALTEEYHLSAGGGTMKTDFYVGSGYHRQNAIIKDLSTERFSIFLNGHQRKTRKVQISESVSFAYLDYRGLNEGCFMNDFDNSILEAIVMPPNKDKDDFDPVNLHNIVILKNPFDDAALEHNRRKNYVFNGNVEAKVNIFKNLNYRSLLGSSIYFQDNTLFSAIVPRNVKYSQTVARYDYQILDRALFWQQSLLYSVNVSAQNQIDMGLDAENRWSSTNWLPKYYEQYDANLQLVAIQDTIEQDAFRNTGKSIDFRYLAYSAHIAWTWRNTLYLRSSLRNDRVKFPDHFGNLTSSDMLLPGISLGWKFKNDKPKSQKRLLSYGKLRYSWGISGNSPSLNYSFYSCIMREMNYVYAFCTENLVTYSARVRRTNYHFYQERSQTHDLGIDLGFFRNKLFLSADMYTSELWEGKKSGVQSPWEMMTRFSYIDQYGIVPPSLSHMRNNGLDLELSYRGHGSHLKWELNTNVSFFRNRIIEVNESEAIAWDGSEGTEHLIFNFPGEVAGSFYGYKIEGIFRSEDCDSNGKAIIQPFTETDGVRRYAQPSAREGDYKFADINGDSVIDENDRIVLGSPQPDFIYGITYHAEWKNFDFTLFVQGSQGNEVFNATKMYLYTPNLHSNYMRDAADSYRPITVTDPGNTDTDLPRISYSANRNLRASDFYVEDGSYLRLKNIQIGYTFSPKFLQKIHLNQFRIYISLQNLYTFTRYTGFDPEVGGWGIDCANFPKSRIFLGGVNAVL